MLPAISNRTVTLKAAQITGVSLVREGCPPRGAGTAEHTTPTPRQRSLASVMGHLYSLLRGGRTLHTMHAARGRNQDQREQRSGGWAAGVGERLVIPVARGVPGFAQQDVTGREVIPATRGPAGCWAGETEMPS